MAACNYAIEGWVAVEEELGSELEGIS